MGMFEYVVVLTGVVIGLALTHLMQGIARIIEHPTRVRIWWVHLGWVLYMIVFAMFWWWFEFRLRLVSSWSLELYSFVLAYAFFIYLICAVLLPSDVAPHAGFKEYFIARRRWFFGMMIGSRAIDFIDTWTKGPAYFKSLGIEYPLAVTYVMSLCAVGMISPRPRVQATVLILIFGYDLTRLARFYDVVR